MSWASIACKTAKPSNDSSSVALTAKEGLKLLVVDANAIIDGVKLEGIADKAVTIQEVLDEIRDKQSRQYLASLPYQLEVSEPSEESIQTVTRFARATGDVAALSTVDIKLLALVHTLEVAAHGAGHLAANPNQPRMHTKASFASEELPGWGSVPNPEDWTAVDEANDADEAALMAASTSRIAQHVQQLTLDPAAPNSFLQEPAAAAAGETPPAAPLTPEAVGGGPQRTAAAAVAAASPVFGTAVAAAAGEAAAGAAAAKQQQSAAADRGHEAAGEDADADAGADAGAGADVWEVAASSKGAARHRRRKAVKKQQHLDAFEEEWAEHTELVQQQQQEAQQQQQEQQSPAVPPSDEQQEQADGQEAEDASAADDGSRAAADASNDELLAEQHCVFTADDLDSPPQQQQQQQQLGGPGSRGWQSSVAIITGDFAMQNVLLQMGLRLITKDGRRIARLTRYALRCSACFAVTREPGRLFCPKCGNLSLDQVEVVVGADGAEYFGVTKRHILRGTRFSLPKPKGGRTREDLVLREDVFLQKVKALGRQAVKKKVDDDDAAVDPFAPEYSQDTWHVPSQQELAQHRGLAAVLQPAWKQNPNERRLTRSNRRG